MASSDISPVSPGSFTQTDEGDVFFAEGSKNVRRWDGLIEDFVDAGVPAPTTKLSMTEDTTGSAELSGTYFSFLRYLDSRGNVSNVSTISDALSLDGNHYGSIDTWQLTQMVVSEVSAYGRLYCLVTSVNHGLSTDDKVRLFGTSLANIYTVVVLSNDTFVFREIFTPHWAFSGATTWRRIGGSIVYTDVEIPTDSRVVKRQILRNKDGNVNTFYVDIEDTDLTDTTFTSEKSDSQLGEAVPLRATDGTDLNSERHSEPPNFKRVIVDHFNRIFAAVNFVYKEGTVYLTKDSPTVDGYGTSWTSAMSGRYLSVNDSSSSKNYTISSVDTATQQLTLGENYEGNTSAASSYSISPENSELVTLHFSETALPESWDRNKTITLSVDPLGGDITGLMPMGPRLYILLDHRVYSLNYITDPSVDGQLSFALTRGCVNQRCWVRDGMAAFLMDEKGVYLFDGNKATNVSSQIQSMFNGDAVQSIDWSYSEHFHAAHDPSFQTIRWFVSLRGSKYPRHALSFNYKTGRWWVEEYAEPISASSTGNLSGRIRSIFCGESKRAMTPDPFPVDGLPRSVDPVRGQVVSATPTKLRGSQFSEDMVGAPVSIAEGTGAGQTRLIVAVDDQYLEVDKPFTILPDRTSYYQVGGFKWTYKTPLMQLASPPGTKGFRSFSTRFKPTDSSSTIILKKFTDFSETPDNMEYSRSHEEGDGVATTEGSPDVLIDTTQSTGSIQQSFDSTDTPRSKRSRSVRFQLEGTPNQEVHKIYEIIVEGVSGQ